MNYNNNIQNICLNCFGVISEKGKCESCKRRKNDSSDFPRYLKPRTLLKKRYLISGVLGSGGFGVTYSAWDLTREVRVAIKEYFPESLFFRDGSAIVVKKPENKLAASKGIKLFTDEAKSMVDIRDLKGVVSVLDFFSENNTAYIVMEFLDGQTLKSYLKRHGRLSLSSAVSLLSPVLEALSILHRTGFLHRDISPDNIMVTKSHSVKLIDFGAAKQGAVENKTLSAMVLKKNYAPEEQYRPMAEHGAYTDVYAIAVTIYYAMTACLPPEAPERKKLDQIKSPSELKAAITPEEEAGLLMALSVDAHSRAQTIDEMLECLGFNPNGIPPFDFAQYEKRGLLARLMKKAF